MIKVWDAMDSSSITWLDAILLATTFLVLWAIQYGYAGLKKVGDARKRTEDRMTGGRNAFFIHGQSHRVRRVEMGVDNSEVQGLCVAVLVAHHDGYPEERHKDARAIGGLVLQAMEDLEPIQSHLM